MDDSELRARECVFEQQDYGTCVDGKEECGLGRREAHIPELPCSTTTNDS